MPTMIPAAPEQPTELFYPLSSLEECPRLTRAKYQDMYGEQAPPWNPEERTNFTGRIKRWFDSSAALKVPEDPYTVNYYEWSGSPAAPVKMTVTITCAEAAVPNLPGTYSYTKYETTEPDAYVAINSGTEKEPKYVGKRQMEARDVCTDTQAELLKGELLTLGFSVLDCAIQEFSSPLVAIYGDGEDRRPWRIAVRPANGTTRNYAVGALLILKYANGIGAPGRWYFDETGTLLWASDIPTDAGEHDLRPEIPIPMRDLLPNEVAVVQITGNYIGRSEDWTPRTTDTTDTTTNDQIATILTQILQRLMTLEEKVGV